MLFTRPEFYLLTKIHNVAYNFTKAVCITTMYACDKTLLETTAKYNADSVTLLCLVQCLIISYRSFSTRGRSGNFQRGFLVLWNQPSCKLKTKPKKKRSLRGFERCEGDFKGKSMKFSQ